VAPITACLTHNCIKGLTRRKFRVQILQIVEVSNVYADWRVADRSAFASSRFPSDVAHICAGEISNDCNRCPAASSGPVIEALCCVLALFFRLTYLCSTSHVRHIEASCCFYAPFFYLSYLCSANHVGRIDFDAGGILGGGSRVTNFKIRFLVARGCGQDRFYSFTRLTMSGPPGKTLSP